MTVGVADTTVVIHLFRRQPVALAWLRAQTQPLSITPTTWMEVMYGAPSKASQSACEAVLGQFSLVYLTAADMDWAMQQIKAYRFSHGVAILNCLIASVCHRLQIPLYTHNVKDMAVLLPTELVVRPY